MPPSSSRLTGQTSQSSNASGFRTPPDQEMMDQTPPIQPSPRPSLPSSSVDFALQASPSAPVSPTTSFMALDDPTSPSLGNSWNYVYNYHNNAAQMSAASAHPLIRKIRRPSLLGIGMPASNGGGLNTPNNGSRLNSPLVSSFTSPSLFGMPSRPASGKSVQPTQDDDEDEEYSPGLLFNEPGPSVTSNRPPGPIILPSPSPSPAVVSGRRHQHRISRSMSPSTPPHKVSDLDGDSSGSQGKLASSRRTPASILLRRTSSSTSLNELPTLGNIAKAQATSSISAGPSTLLSQPKRIPALPRLRNIITESDAADVEVKSEARFQKYIASHAEIPAPFRAYPLTPRSRAGSSTENVKRPVWPTERGRFPEEACDTIDDEEGSASSDDAEAADEPGTAPMSFVDDSGPLSVSLGGGGSGLGIHRGSSGSLGTTLESPAGMDVDVGTAGSWMCGSPPVTLSGMNSSGSTPNQWRHTPPPSMVSHVSRKRKLEGDPFSSSKRRAVSPAVSTPYFGHPSLASPITISRPLPMPLSASSSPILRPIVRLSGQYSHANSSGNGSSIGSGSSLLGLGINSGNGNGSLLSGRSGEKDVAGTGDAVGSLKL